MSRMIDAPRPDGDPELSLSGCGCCHKCLTRMRLVLDGEEWCRVCNTYRRYRSHGWGALDVEAGPCPADLLDTMNRAADRLREAGRIS